MTERLQRIHENLRQANVPCALDTEPGLGVILRAGNPDSARWDVLVTDAGGQLRIHHARGVISSPEGSSDAVVADAIKLAVVRSWADQGHPEARALIARLSPAAGPGYSSSRDPDTHTGEYDTQGAMLPFVDPLLLAERLFSAAFHLGSMAFAPPTSSIQFSVWTPWGTVRSGYTRH